MRLPVDCLGGSHRVSHPVRTYCSQALVVPDAVAARAFWHAVNEDNLVLAEWDLDETRDAKRERLPRGGGLTSAHPEHVPREDLAQLRRTSCSTTPCRAADLAASADARERAAELRALEQPSEQGLSRRG